MPEGFNAKSATCISVSSPLSRFVDNVDFSDVSFTMVPSGIVYYAHAVILSASSPVFDAMLKSRVPQSVGIFNVQIVDIDCQSFLNLLCFMYSGECYLDESCVFGTLYAAKKYFVDCLLNACCEFLVLCLSCDNVLSILEHCLFFDANNVAESCIQYVFNHFDSVMQNRNLVYCSIDTLHEIFSHDEVPCSESEILSFVNAWSLSQCQRLKLDTTSQNKRDVIGRLLWSIRFPLMSISELVNKVLPTEILSSDEFLDIVSHSRGYSLSSSSHSRLGFSSIPRYLPFLDCVSSDLITVYRMTSVKSCKKLLFPKLFDYSLFTAFSEFAGIQEISSNCDCSITFLGGLEICFELRTMLVGIQLFSQSTSSNYSISVEILKCDDPVHVVVSRFDNLNVSNKYRQLIDVCDVLFDRPVLILPNSWYRLTISFSGPLPCYYCDEPFNNTALHSSKLLIRKPQASKNLPRIPYALFSSGIYSVAIK